MKRIIATADAPAAIGPYAQGVIAGDYLFVSGQIAFIPGEGKKLDNQSVQTETHRIMKNIAAILKAGGCNFSDVVRARIYITSPEIFLQVNEVYADYFTDGAVPARECVVAQPPVEGAHVEISVDALLPVNN